jgi:hypothetical protein
MISRSFEELFELQIDQLIMIAPSSGVQDQLAVA